MFFGAERGQSGRKFLKEAAAFETAAPVSSRAVLRIYSILLL